MKLQKINKSYADSVIFRDFDLEIAENEVTAVMGASGVGKSTLLNVIAGLTQYEGTVEREGDVAYVFSEHRLLPNLTVRANLEYATKHAIKDKAVRAAAIEAALAAVELKEWGDKYPAELSTGMSQRVSLVRAFVFPSRYVLMDEPFRGLDAALKSRLIEYFHRLFAENPRTVLLVTHEPTEAAALASRIITLEGSPARVASDVQI